MPRRSRRRSATSFPADFATPHRPLGIERAAADQMEKEVLLLVYKQSRWSAWAAIAAGLAALFAIADGLLPGT
jgi:hypothetical protein